MNLYSSDMNKPMTRLEALATESCVTVEWLRTHLKREIEKAKNIDQALSKRVRRFK